MTTARFTQDFRATPDAIYRALTTSDGVASWMFPDDMTIHVDTFDARPGGQFRISLTYNDPSAIGKTADRTDTYAGRFTTLIPGSRVDQELSFETSDAAMQGAMTLTYVISPLADGRSRLDITHAGVPPGVSPADNDTGWRMSLARLKAYLER